ncbi:MAG: hypothetical protein Q9227_005831 [Pyrenula ochraceoflavens]
MAKSLPKSGEGDSSLLRDRFSAAGLFAHACMVVVGFRLKGLGEDHNLGTQTNAEESPSLPADWNKYSTTEFRYAHSQSSMEFLVKVSRLGQKAVILAVGLGDDKTASFEFKVEDYVSDGALKEVKKDSDLADRLRAVFISSGRLEDLSSLFKINIIQKIAPGLRKAGYEDDAEMIRPRRREDEPAPPPHRPETGDRYPEPARPHPFDDPLAAPPRRPIPAGDFPPPGFEDEYEIYRPPRGMPGPGERRPLNIGERDLYPPGLAPHDPLRMGPPGGFGGPGGGMHPTFDDPLFGGGQDQGHFDPRVPPGARYDPIGPGGGPPQGLGGPRFPGGPRGGGGGNPFGSFGGGDFI